MDQQGYQSLITKELKKLPKYITLYANQPNLATTTVYQYLTEFRRFFTWLRQAHNLTVSLEKIDSNKDINLEILENLRTTDINQYLTYLRTQINKQHTTSKKVTLNRTIKALRSLYHFLTVTSDFNNGEPYFYRNVMLKIPLEKGTKDTLAYRNAKFSPLLYTGEKKHKWINFIEHDYEVNISTQAHTLFLFNKKRDLAIVSLLLGSGIRISELTRLNVKDLDLAQERIYVTRKGGRRDAPLVARWAIPYLKDYLDIRQEHYGVDKYESALFLAKRGHQPAKRIATNTVEALVNRYSTAFGSRTTPHKLRHSLGTELYEKTKDVMVVATQLGHTGISATDQYIQEINSDNQKEKLNRTS
ncbi:tyrosine recombinase XerS (plasmid) [Lactobacillus sp. PV037]|uniref:tyrosine recombinase XerS n=1 Tax=Lactobacillus sp. PV037 TaxID=2594496 RepID=UPI00224009C9|nr:tyrosine recombinase XerS [Lactobacillus sp. PV037]QNQ82959.1 tyrosine recombinase XerS [Lactobacillus sp. PV037]